MLGENAHIANVLGDAVAALGLGKEAAEAVGGDVRLNVFGVNAAASLGNARFANVGSKKLNVCLGGLFAEKFEQGNGDRIGFFA